MTKMWIILALLPSSCYDLGPQSQQYGPFETEARCQSAMISLQRAELIQRDLISGTPLAACIEVLR